MDQQMVLDLVEEAIDNALSYADYLDAECLLEELEILGLTVVPVKGNA